MIDKHFDALRAFYQAGLRSLGPLWSRPNKYSHGVPFDFPAAPDIGDGLTKAGKRPIKACNELGILVDLSHLNEKGFWDAAKLSDAPLVCTHSGAHACCALPRNLLDSQLAAIKETNGVVGVNLHKGFLREDGHPTAETSLAEIVRHAAYIAGRSGVDHVALGSDFDGAQMPEDLKDAAGRPQLLTAFREHGFNEAEIAQISHGNWLRVLRQTWREAQRFRQAQPAAERPLPEPVEGGFSLPSIPAYPIISLVRNQVTAFVGRFCKSPGRFTKSSYYT